MSFEQIEADLIQKVRSQFFVSGTTIREWAQQKGYSEALVYSVLAGRLKCRSGQAHQIAVALGLKDKPPQNLKKRSAKP